MKKYFLLLFLHLSLFAVKVAGQSKQGGYSLFKPVPKEQMREMATDRPDKTETPFTVDAGHYQIETSLFSYSKQHSEESKTSTYTLNAFEFNLGLTNSTALQFMMDTYVVEDEKTFVAPIKNRHQGIGDLTIRLKQNFLGNNTGNFAIALLPYLKLPTAKYKAHNMLEAGLMVPMHIKLPLEWSLSTQLEIDRLQDEEQHKPYTEFMQSLSLSHELFKDMDGIAETYYTYGFKKHQWTNYVNAALQYAVNSNCKLDAGLNYAVQHDAERSFFLGMAYRF